jgi:CheY-like chemotaxis protein
MDAQIARGKLRESFSRSIEDPKRVLVVEDEDAVRRLVVRLLADAGYEVEIACDAEDTIEAFIRGEEFDLVICDAQMKDSNGGRLVQRLRRLAPELPILHLDAIARALRTT